MSPLEMIYNAHSVSLDHLIKNARSSKYRVLLLVYVDLFISTSPEAEELGILDLYENKIIDMPMALIDTKDSETVFMSNHNLIFGQTVRLNVSAAACPDFKVDFETNRVSGRFAMNQRPYFFDVPTQVVAGVLVEGVPVGVTSDVRSTFITELIQKGMQTEQAEQEKPKAKPTLTVVK